jgi:ABC-type dipeptide/oligopeptide/nickel transport system ATPase component
MHLPALAAVLASFPFAKTAGAYEMHRRALLAAIIALTPMLAMADESVTWVI